MKLGYCKPFDFHVSSLSTVNNVINHSLAPIGLSIPVCKYFLVPVFLDLNNTYSNYICK